MSFDHFVQVICPTPGYPIYESVVRYMNGTPVPLTLKTTETGDLQWDWAALRSRLTPKTRIFIWNDGHNPTGHLASQEDREEVVRIATEYNMWVLSDEAYFHMTYEIPVLPSIATFPGMRERTVILITASKSWSCTGWRVGAAVGPRKVIDMFGKLTCNDESMTTNFAQWACIPAFNGECDGDIAHIRGELKKRRDVLHNLVNQIPGFSAPLPQSLLDQIEKGIV
jgi:aspartate/methionine/tyrosine aminotransferase